MKNPALLVLLVLLLVPTAAPAATTSTVVVDQVFAGGGNAGAPYANDYVVLFNRGSASVDISSWTLQYASAASSSWSVTALTGSIPAGGHHLIQLGSGGTVGAALPAPDSTGTLSLAASGGKVAVVKQAAALTCSSCASVTAVADLVGWGTAADFEGSAAAPALTNTTAALRDSSGCSDTNDNAADFSTGTPAPHNSSTAVALCSGGTTSTGLTGSVNVTLDLQPVLSLSLNRTSVAFGAVLAGATPAPVSVAATVVSNSATGYSLTAHRTAFAPADLPLAISARAGDPLVLLPVAPAADLQITQTSAPSLAAGDVWTTTLGFVGPLAALTPARYTATVTYTVLAR